MSAAIKLFKTSFLPTAAFIVILLAMVTVIQPLLMPKYTHASYEGLLSGEYYADARPHDVIFLGDCEVYETYSPVTMWREYGVSSYIRGGPQQLFWESYYLLKETLQYEKPQAVVLNVLAMRFDSPQDEAYNRLNLDNLRMSTLKLEDISVAMTKNEHLIDYIFPILRYHSRWNMLEKDDFSRYANPAKTGISGFMVRSDAVPVDVIPEGRRLKDYAFGEMCREYLDKIADMCAENGIELVLVKSPAIYPKWYPQWDAQVKEYAEKRGLTFLNFLEGELNVSLGIDWNTDTWDGGSHLNVFGAEKMARVMGKWLTQELGVPDRRGEQPLADAWARKAAQYDLLKEVQQKEIKESGRIFTYIY